MEQTEVYRVKDWNRLYENNRTRNLEKMRWVPVPNKLDGDGYTDLVDHANGAAHLGCWLAILQVASKCQPRGTLVRDGGTPHTAASLARITRLPAALFDELIPRLLAPSIGWLEIAQPSAGIPHPPAACTQATDYRKEWNGNEIESSEIESNEGAQVLIAPERIYHAREVLGAHRRRKTQPDEVITRKILLQFEDLATFDKWAASLGEVDPSEITGEGYAFYLADAQRWIENGGKRAKRRRRPAQASTPQDTTDPETRRRIEAARRPALKPAKYFDVNSITGELPGVPK